MADHHLAQVNIALPKEPLESPLLADFVAWLEPVNARADGADGFVWRLQTDEGDATAIKAFNDDRLIVNMSVWESIEALEAFAYRDRGHLAVVRRRREWFERMDTFMVLWWVPAGHRPTVEEAEDRLALLRQHGPTQEAFTFRDRFPDPEGAITSA
jgi:hypothetical protein